MSIVSFINRKGGVGKSSTTHHAAGTLAKSGRRVLVLDCDPQSSLTAGIFGPRATDDLDPAATIAALYAGLDPYPESLIHATPIPGIWIVPGSQAAEDYNVPRPGEADPAMQTCVRSFLDEVKGRFDVVLIDCPPTLALASWSALVAADRIVVPVMCEDYGAMGLGPVLDSIAAVTAAANPTLRLAGFVCTMFNPRLAIHALYDSLLREQYGDLVFSARVPIATDYKEAIAARQPISHYKPRSAAAKAMQAVVDEMMARLEASPAAAPSEAA